MLKTVLNEHEQLCCEASQLLQNELTKGKDIIVTTVSLFIYLFCLLVIFFVCKDIYFPVFPVLLSVYLRVQKNGCTACLKKEVCANPQMSSFINQINELYLQCYNQ